jgi:hypothetical protein
MTGWQLALIFKPFGLLLMFAPGAVIVYLLRKRLPSGRLKRFLLFSWKV